MTLIDLTNALKSLLVYADPEIDVRSAYDYNVDDPRHSKTVIVRATNARMLTPGLGDAFVTVEILGFTFVSEDHDRAQLNAICAATQTLINGWTMAQITAAINRDNITADGLIDQQVSSIDAEDSYVFNLTFTLAIQNFNT